MEQLVILIIIGLISLVNWIIQRSAELREKRKLERMRQEGIEKTPEEEGMLDKPPVSPRPVNPPIEMRKLMEALGLPIEDEEEPAPVVRPFPVQQELSPPPLPEKPREPASVVLPPPPIVTVPSLKGEPMALDTSLSASESKWAKLLASRDGMRQAIVLSEVLGPPKAFGL